MAIKESALAAITSIAQSDFVRAVTAAGASRRITVANLAKAIVENYTGSSLAGSAQSVKSAIDSLRSYKKGDTVSLSSIKAIGRSTSSRSEAFVLIQLAKPIDASVSTATIEITSGRAYSDNSSQALTAQTLSAESLSKDTGGVKVTVPVGSSLTNNSIVLLDQVSGTITFS